MSTQGKIKTLYSDKERTEALFPRTKLSAVSDNDGTGLNVLLEGMNTQLNQLSTDIATKAPDGYGLGSYAETSSLVTDANAAVKSGWYGVTATTENGIGYGGVMLVCAFNANFITQEIYAGSITSRAVRWCLNGFWGEWEWDNPPMVMGVEYRTTERYREKAVYTKVVNFGYLPNATAKSVAFCTTGATQVIDLKLCLINGYILSSGYGKDRSTSVTDGINLDNTLYNVRVYTESDFSNLTAYAIVKYTKD